MTNLNFDKENTALLVIDPYNDFVSEGGKVWDRIQRVAEANDCMPHMLQLVNAARTAGLPVFYALHHRYRPGDYQTWKYIAPIQKAAWSLKTFEYGTWGGEIHKDFAPQAGDVVVQETLGFERLCEHGFGLAAQKTWRSQADRYRVVDPNTLLFFVVFASQDAYDSHIQQEHTKSLQLFKASWRKIRFERSCSSFD